MPHFESNSSCRLCGNANPQLVANSGRFRLEKCEYCQLIQKPASLLLSADAEAERYGAHQNDLKDPGYFEFLNSTAKLLLERESSLQRGLDYGCGPAGESGLKRLVKEQYQLNLEIFDPLFAPIKPQGVFDYIVASEVVEHFHRPQESWRELHQLLKPQGRLYFRTEFYQQTTDFTQWWYLRDQTHVAFYTHATILWIEKHLGWKILFLSATHGILQRA